MNTPFENSSGLWLRPGRDDGSHRESSAGSAWEQLQGLVAGRLPAGSRP